MIQHPSIRRRCRAAAEAPPCNPLHHNLRLVTVYRSLGELEPPRRALRKHGKRQLAALKASISEFGILKQILTDQEGHIIAGYGVWLAAKELGMAEVPTICVTHLSPEQLRLYAICDNQIPLLEEPWDDEALRLELSELSELSSSCDLNLDLTGLPSSRIDDILAIRQPSDPDGQAEDDDLPEVPVEPVTRLRDIWLCGASRLLCGNALEAESYDSLLGEERAQLVIADPPYNVKINGHVSGTGRHEEFAMASGEMSRPEFTGFLVTAFGHLARYSIDGSIQFLFMDWRHMGEMLASGEQVYSELKNLLIWDKQSAGMGTFYRSQHELLFAWKNGTAPHINNFGLGETGRYRTNVLSYPGCAGFRRGRDADLTAHSTVKSTNLVSDLIRDCSKRGGIVLDCFGGAGTTLTSAERTGRRARLIELEPRYCDVTVRRWEKLTGEDAVLEATGQTFDEVEADRFDEDGEA